MSIHPGVGECKPVIVLYHTHLDLRLVVMVIDCIPVFAKPHYLFLSHFLNIVVLTISAADFVVHRQLLHFIKFF